MPQDESKIDPELAEFVQKFLDTMFAGKECPHCHTPLERKEQIGGCVYGVPCGCRMYHGSVDLHAPEEEAAK